MIDILNDKKYEVEARLFRANKINRYPATEIAFINRHINGEKGFVINDDFSMFNLNLIKSLNKA